MGCRKLVTQSPSIIMPPMASPSSLATTYGTNHTPHLVLRIYRVPRGEQGMALIHLSTLTRILLPRPVLPPQPVWIGVWRPSAPEIVSLVMRLQMAGITRSFLWKVLASIHQVAATLPTVRMMEHGGAATCRA